MTASIVAATFIASEGEYLEAVIEEGDDDPAVITQALGAIARSRNLSEIAATRDLVAAEQAATEVTAVLSEKDAMFSLAAEMLVEGEGRDFDVRDC